MKTDIFSFRAGAPVLSDRAKCALEKVTSGCVEWLSADLKKHRVWILNVVNVLNCLDLGNSEYQTAGDGFVRRVNKHAFLKSAVDEVNIFKIRETPDRPIYVSDRFVDAVFAAELEGFSFYLVWDEDMPMGVLECWGAQPGDYRLENDLVLRKRNARITQGYETKWLPVEGGYEGLLRRARSGEERAPGKITAEQESENNGEFSPLSHDGLPMDDEIAAVRGEALRSLPALPCACGAATEPSEVGGLPRLLRRLAGGHGSSQVGGVPLLAEGEPWPLGPGGEPLRLLARVDYSEAPRVPGLPAKGLLQLFVSREPDLGLGEEGGFRVLWRPEGARGLTERPDPLSDPYPALPVAFGRGLSESEPFDVDFRAEEAFALKWNELHPGLPVSKYHEDADRYASGCGFTWGLSAEDERECTDVQLGGYPDFLQVDPRSYDPDERRYDALALQVSPPEWSGIELGDGGRAYLFAPAEALARGDFSDVMFWWDCG